jgi:hypothetical protein
VMRAARLGLRYRRRGLCALGGRKGFDKEATENLRALRVKS